MITALNLPAIARTGFYLDEATHTYWYEGRQIPGLSHLLKFWGFIDPTYYTERGREIGTAVHAGTVFLDKGTLDWSKVLNPEIEGRLHAYERFMIEQKPLWLYSEKAFCYPGGLYGCKIDRAGRTKTVPHGVFEIKCGGKAAWHRLQVALQKFALPPSAWRRFVIYLRENGTYEMVEHRDTSDYIAVSMASLYNWRTANGYTTPH